MRRRSSRTCLAAATEVPPTDLSRPGPVGSTKDTKQTPCVDGFCRMVITVSVLEGRAKPLIQKEFRPTFATLLFVSCLVSQTGLLGLWTLFMVKPGGTWRKRLI